MVATCQDEGAQGASKGGEYLSKTYRENVVAIATVAVSGGVTRRMRYVKYIHILKSRPARNQQKKSAEAFWLVFRWLIKGHVSRFDIKMHDIFYFYFSLRFFIPVYFFYTLATRQLGNLNYERCLLNWQQRVATVVAKKIVQDVNDCF